MSGGTHKKQLLTGPFPDQITKALKGQVGSGVWLLHIRRQLRENVVEADSHRCGDVELLLDDTSHLIRHKDPRLGRNALRQYQPRLVHSVRINLSRKTGEYLPGLLCILGVLVIPRRYHHKIRALPSRHHRRLARSDSKSLGVLVFRQHDAVTKPRISAHRHGYLRQSRHIHRFHRCKIIIHITVQYRSHICLCPKYPPRKLPPSRQDSGMLSNRRSR